jgi:hypothetical protein
VKTRGHSYLRSKFLCSEVSQGLPFERMVCRSMHEAVGKKIRANLTETCLVLSKKLL